MTAPSQREPLVGSHRNKGRSVGRIGGVVLWVDCRWNRCSEPSQALRASSPGGRAKGMASIDGLSVKFRFMGLFAMNDLSNSAISCRGDAMSSPGAV